MMTIIEKPTSSKTSKTFCLEAFCAALPQWAERIQMRVEQSIRASDQNLVHLEELVLKDTKEIQRKAVEEAAQKAPRHERRFPPRRRAVSDRFPR